MKPYRYGKTSYSAPAGWDGIGEYAAYAKAQEVNLTKEQLITLERVRQNAAKIPGLGEETVNELILKVCSFLNERTK